MFPISVPYPYPLSSSSSSSSGSHDDARSSDESGVLAFSHHFLLRRRAHSGRLLGATDAGAEWRASRCSTRGVVVERRRHASADSRHFRRRQRGRGHHAGRRHFRFQPDLSLGLWRRSSLPDAARRRVRAAWCYGMVMSGLTCAVVWM